MKGLSNYLQLIIVIVIIFFINVIANFYHGYIDLTEEKRFTLSESTENIVKNVDEVVFVRVLLDGEFPAGFKRLQQSAKDLLADLNDINPLIQYTFEDPSAGTIDEKKARREQLSKDGIIPTNLNFFDGSEYVQKAIYPYALISYKNRFSVISLLQPQAAGQDENQILNKSVELLEYKFANMLQKLESGRKKNILFTSGNGELPQERTIRLQTELSPYYNTGRANIDTIPIISDKIDLIIVPGPRKYFTDQSKFKIDQYIMNGGKVIWMIDKMDASLDSISRYGFYVPTEYDLNLDDQFFKYGIRIQSNLILDLESSSIPQIVGEQGGKPQTSLFKWFYHVLATPLQTHPITKNIGRVNTQFPSTIDTVKTKTDIKNTVLLSSSPYSRYQLSPMRLNFEMLKLSPDPSKFDKGEQPIAVLSEGVFPSLYTNRITPTFQSGLDQLGVTFKEESPVTKQLFISDSDFIKNVLNFGTQQAEPLGYNVWDRKQYEGNKEFILNTIEYMMDENGVLESRSKDIKLRMLNATKTAEEESKWQFINIGIPIVAILLFGLIFNFIRKRRYAKTS